MVIEMYANTTSEELIAVHEGWGAQAMSECEYEVILPRKESRCSQNFDQRE